MKKLDLNNNIWFKYAEGVAYCIGLVICVLLCAWGNIYIKMLPIGIVIGILGQMLFGKRAMTTTFSGILAIIMLQMRYPAVLKENILNTLAIIAVVGMGEVCGYAIKRLIKLFRLKKNDRRKREKIKFGAMGIAALVVGIIINGYANGNYITYFKTKNTLKNFFVREYGSGSRFKIASCKYTVYSSPRYTFYTYDTIQNNEIGKFTVYTNDVTNVQDEYEEAIAKKEVIDLNKKIDEIQNENGIKREVNYDTTNVLTLNLAKEAEDVNKEQVEIYAKELAKDLEEILKVENVEKIKQICITLNSSNNSKESISTIIFMQGYKDMLEKNEEEAYVYITRALNIEFFE